MYLAEPCTVIIIYIFFFIYLILAACSQGCYNGGTCTSPGVCTCPSGWGGDDCTRGMFLHMYKWILSKVYVLYMSIITKKDKYCGHISLYRNLINIYFYKHNIIKTHGSVSCVPRSLCTTPVSMLTGRTIT